MLKPFYLKSGDIVPCNCTLRCASHSLISVTVFAGEASSICSHCGKIHFWIAIPIASIP